MAKERRDDSFIKKPIFPGGPKAFRKFIKENLKYPKDALSEKIEGTVHLKYTIDHKGKVIETKVVKGVGGGCSEEACRILKLLQFEVPKNPRKLRVTFHQKTQITFKLPKTKPAKKPTPKTIPGQTTQFKYVFKPSAKKQNEEQNEKGKVSYTYSISGNIKDLMS